MVVDVNYRKAEASVPDGPFVRVIGNNKERGVGEKIYVSE